MVNNSLEARGHLGPSRFDVCIRLLQAGADREHDERAQMVRIGVPRERGGQESTGDMIEGKVP